MFQSLIHTDSHRASIACALRYRTGAPAARGQEQAPKGYFASNTATCGVAQSSMWRCHTSGWQPLVVGIIHQKSLRPKKEPQI
jgi:hypothetical protein